jgi:hypothetical protein
MNDLRTIIEGFSNDAEGTGQAMVELSVHTSGTVVSSRSMPTAPARKRSKVSKPRIRKTCYVCVPYGRKRPLHRPGNVEIDFDALYYETIKPAVERAGYVAYRGDEPELGGIIQRTMIRLVADSDVMIADMTNWSPNVLYQIGLRHALRRRTTILIGAEWERIPYDLSHFARIPYQLAGERPTADEQRILAAAIAVTLDRRVRSNVTDSLVHDGHVLASGASFAEFLALPPQHVRYETKLGQFRREASFEKSVFIMTKFPEGEAAKAAELRRVIKTVKDSIKAAGFVPRIASERMYFDDVWSNVELYLLGCRYGVAIVEGHYLPELNPNVAMEWGWMRGLGKDVLFLVEKKAHKYIRADWSGLIRREFSWREPHETIPRHVRAWLESRV